MTFLICKGANFTKIDVLRNEGGSRNVKVILAKAIEEMSILIVAALEEIDVLL